MRQTAIARQPERRRHGRWVRPRRALPPTTRQQVHRRRQLRSEAAHPLPKPSYEDHVRNKQPMIQTAHGTRREVAGRRMPVSMRHSASNLLLLRAARRAALLWLTVVSGEPDLRLKVSNEEDPVPAWCEMLVHLEPRRTWAPPAGTLAVSQ